MDRLVSVDTKELVLHFSGTSSESSSASFRISNLMHTMPVAVHLSTTRPSSFTISPSSPSILPPLSSSSSFSIHFLPSHSHSLLPLVAPPDTLLVRSALLPTGKADAAHLLRLFSLSPSSKPLRRPASASHVFTDARIPISFVGPDALRSLLHLSSSSSSRLALDTAFLFSKAASACSPSDLSSLLLRATAAGNPRFAAALLDAGADPRFRDPDRSDRSALSLAVAAGSLETVELLLAAGARVDPALDRHVMHDASAGNRVDLMTSLAAHSDRTAWAGAVDSAGRTPIHVAAARGHPEAVRFCIDGGSDPDRVDAAGWTPLHLAAAGGFVEVAEILLSRSAYAKYALTGDGRKTAFDLAVDSAESGSGDGGDERRLLDLLRLGDQIQRAAAAGDEGGVRSCLEKGAAVDGRDQNGWTPLHRAAFKGRTEVVEILLDNGAEVDAKDDAGYTPVRLAAEAGHSDVVVCLLSHGAARAGLKGVVVARRRKGVDGSCSPSSPNAGVAAPVKMVRFVDSSSATCCAGDAIADLPLPSSLCGDSKIIQA